MKHLRTAAVAAALAVSLPRCAGRIPQPVDAIVSAGLDCLGQAKAPADVERCAAAMAADAQATAMETCAAGGTLLAEALAGVIAGARAALSR